MLRLRFVPAALQFGEALRQSPLLPQPVLKPAGVNMQFLFPSVQSPIFRFPGGEIRRVADSGRGQIGPFQSFTGRRQTAVKLTDGFVEQAAGIARASGPPIFFLTGESGLADPPLFFRLGLFPCLLRPLPGLSSFVLLRRRPGEGFRRFRRLPPALFDQAAQGHDARFRIRHRPCQQVGVPVLFGNRCLTLLYHRFRRLGLRFGCSPDQLPLFAAGFRQLQLLLPLFPLPFQLCRLIPGLYGVLPGLAGFLHRLFDPGRRPFLNFA